MRSLAPNDNKLVREFAMKNDQKDEFFHSSSYGTAQNAGNIGTASTGMTMDERQAIEEKRKFVQKYNNSKIFESTYGLRHAKKYIPRTEGGENALFDMTAERTSNRTNVSGDADGNVRTGFGRSAGEIGGRPGERTGNSYTPYSTGSSSAPSRPSPAAGFSANIKPSFK
jgi:hypothetical protein